MRDRVYRRYQKARIKKRLIDKAIQRYNRYPGGFHTDGSFVDYIYKADDLPRQGYNSIRLALRNEGKGKRHVYQCGQYDCEWCIADLLHKQKKRLDAMKREWISWEAGDYLPDADDVDNAEIG